MAYRALARKYRSQHFGELIGQEVLVRTLSHAIEKNRIHHAYLFTGIRGTGKTSTARILAKAINYAGVNGDQNPTTGPTDDCPICQAITADQHPDVIEIDAASNTGVDDVRQIIENARYAPMQARYKVFIIDEVHMLSKNAFNALLKTLEEPPSHVVFMLATTEIRKVPVTILSRCQRFDLRRIEAPVLAAHYKKIAAAENISIDDEAIQIIARAAEGSARDGLSILDQAIAQAEEEHVSTDMLRRMLGQADRDAVAQLLHSLLDNKIQDVLNTVQQLYRHGADPLVLLEDILDGIHLITRIKIKSDVADDVAISPRLRQTAVQLAPKMDLAILSRVWQMLLKAQSEVAQASQPLQTLEMALIRICYGAQLPPLDELSKRITTQETSTSPALPQSPAPPTAPVTQMKIVSSTLASQIIQPALEQLPNAVSDIHIKDIYDLIALCEKNNDPMLAADLYANVRVINIQQGQVEFVPLPGSSKDLVTTLSKRLFEWTGKRWMIAVASSGGSPSLAEQRRDTKNEALEKAQQDPALTPWRKAFPNLTLTDITME